MQNTGARPKEKTVKKSKRTDEFGVEKAGDERERNKLCLCKGEKDTLQKFNKENRPKIRRLLEQEYFFKIEKPEDDQEVFSTILSCSCMMRKEDVDLVYLEEEIKKWVQKGRHLCVLDKILNDALDNVQKESQKHTNEELLNKLKELNIKRVDNMISPEARDISDTLGLNTTDKEEVKEMATYVRRMTNKELGGVKREQFKKQPIQPAVCTKISMSDLIAIEENDSDQEAVIPTQELQPKEEMEIDTEEPAAMTKGDLLNETKGKKEKELKSDSFAKRLFKKYAKVIQVCKIIIRYIILILSLTASNHFTFRK